MSGYATADVNLKNISFTTVKAVTGASFSQNKTRAYVLDNQIPINATAWGIKITSKNDLIDSHVAIGRMDGLTD